MSKWVWYIGWSIGGFLLWLLVVVPISNVFSHGGAIDGAIRGLILVSGWGVYFYGFRSIHRRFRSQPTQTAQVEVSSNFLTERSETYKPVSRLSESPPAALSPTRRSQGTEKSFARSPGAAVSATSEPIAPETLSETKARDDPQAPNAARTATHPGAFPHVLLAAVFLATLFEVGRVHGPAEALGAALGLCLIPAVLGLVWSRANRKSDALKWAYVGTSMLVALILVGAHIEDEREAALRMQSNSTSQDASTTPPYVAAPTPSAPVQAYQPAAPAPPSPIGLADLSPNSSGVTSPALSNSAAPPIRSARSRIALDQANSNEPARRSHANSERGSDGSVNPNAGIGEDARSPVAVPATPLRRYRDFSTVVALGTKDEILGALNQGASPNDRNSVDAPLVAAARYGRAEIVLLLLERGADVEAIGSGGRTAMYHAKMNADTAVIEILQQWGASNPFGN